MIDILAKWRVEILDENVIHYEEINREKFQINDMNSNKYTNRKIKIYQGIVGESLRYDGYATYSKGQLSLNKNISSFTISCWVLPLSFEQESGIIYQANKNENVGFYISINKWGQINFWLGNKKQNFSVISKEPCLTKGQWNHLTTIFDGEVGWAYIFVNGIEVCRQQMIRNMEVITTSDECYIGNLNNDNPYAGIFNGYIDNLVIHNKALDEVEIYNLYKRDLQPYNNHIPYVDIESIMLKHKDLAHDLQRPQFHLCPNEKWMNEPHAPIYFEGYYHIFFQSNPHSAIWNNIQWGHLISTDMVHWTEVKLALETIKGELDQDGCWSGSCCVDEKGIPTIFYTAGNDNKVPNQMIAVAKSDYLKTGNKKLLNWVKHQHPVLTQHNDISWYGEFRDPYVWKEDNTWYMLVGTGAKKNGGGNAILYTSINMFDWTYRGFIIDYEFETCKEVGHIWELPVLLPLKDDDGKIIKYVLLFCSCQIDNDSVETYYFEGEWDKINYCFKPNHRRPKLIDYGFGTFTGGAGFITPDGRSVFYTIAQGKRTMEEEFEAGWAHNGGLPLELFWHRNHCLGIKPIKELKTLRNEKLLDLENIELGLLNKLLFEICNNKLELRLRLNLSSDEIGIGVMHDETQVYTYYNRNKQRIGVNRDGVDVGRYRGDVDKIQFNSTEMEITLYLDYSMLEVYFNNIKSVTLRQYVTQDTRKLKLFGNEDIIVSKVELWSLNAMFEKA